MAGEKVRLTGEQATLLATLYGRALDSVAERPILGDRYAADAVRRIDFDFRKTKITPGTAGGVALRARQLDAWTAEFLAGRPRAVVVHLGCGLDSRVYRLDPPPGVRWYDIDHPEVIDLRRRLYPERAGYSMIGSSVTAPGWVEELPADGPAVVVAEGLLVYLAPDDGRRLVRRLTAHFGSGELVCDMVSRFGLRLQRLNRPLQAAGASLRWAFTGPDELERVDPRLTCATVVGAFDLPGTDRLPMAYRVLSRVLNRVPVLNQAAWLLRYRW